MTRFEYLRRLKGVSQDALGNELLYSSAVVSRLERGALPSERVSRRLRRAVETYFGESLDDLLRPQVEFDENSKLA